MIAGIVVFVAVATSAAFGSPCGVVSNGCGGNFGFVNSGLNGGVLTGGVNGFGYSGCGVRSSGCGVASSVVATPVAVSAPTVVAAPVAVSAGCGLQAPVTSSVNSVVGNAREVVATEAVVPEYSTLVTPTVSNIGSSCGSGVSNYGIVSSGLCGSSRLSTGVIRTSGVVSTGNYGCNGLSTGVLGTSCGLLSSRNYGCNGLSTGVVSSRIVSSPVTTVVAAPRVFSSCGISGQSGLYNQCGTSRAVVSSPVTTVLPAPRICSSCGSATQSGVCNQCGASRTVISAPIVEPTNVAVPIVSRVSRVCGSGSSFNGCGNVCGC